MNGNIEYGVKAAATVDNMKAEFEYIGEGYSGDYEPLELGDRPLLRLYLFKKDEDGEWQEVEDGSVCTLVVAGTPTNKLKEILRMVCMDFLSSTEQEVSVRRCVAKYSFLDLNNYKELLAA